MAPAFSRTLLQNRATSAQRNRITGWINERRWTVSHKATSIRAATMGLGYAWYPEETIREELDNGQLKPLPLAEGGERAGTLYLMYADREAAGPGVRRLAELIREGVATCSESSPVESSAIAGRFLRECRPPSRVGH